MRTDEGESLKQIGDTYLITSDIYCNANTRLAARSAAGCSIQVGRGQHLLQMTLDVPETPNSAVLACCIAVVLLRCCHHRVPAPCSCQHVGTVVAGGLLCLGALAAF